METNMMVKVGGDSIFCVFENVTKIGKNSKASGKMQRIEKVKNCFKNVTKTNSLPQSKQKKKKRIYPLWQVEIKISMTTKDIAIIMEVFV